MQGHQKQTHRQRKRQTGIKRKVMDHNQLRDYIRSFSLNDCARGSQGYNRVLLQLFGLTGYGKSAFINSCKFALDGEYVRHAVDSDANGGVTLVRAAYPLTDTVTIVDNRAAANLRSSERTEIYAQLGNFRPLNEAVKWSHSYIEILEMSENMEPNRTDIVVPIYIYSADLSLPRQEVEDLKTFLKTCHKMSGIFPIVVLTNKSCRNPITLEETFKTMGAKVFSVENYTSKDHMPIQMNHINILNVLKTALDEVKFYMENERNPIQEHKERRRLLLKAARDVFVEEQKKEYKEREFRRT